MDATAAPLEVFFTDRLIRQRQASAHTIVACRDTWRLLVSEHSSQAERLLHRAMRDALTKTTALLVLIAEAKARPTAAAAAEQLAVLLGRVGNLEHVEAAVQRKVTRWPASRVVH